MTIHDYIELIRMEHSNKGKASIFTKAKEEHPHIAEIFNAAYTPRLTYGVLNDIPTSVPTTNQIMVLENGEDWDHVSVLLSMLATRELSGGLAKDHIVKMLSHFHDKDQTIIRNIIMRDLHCGFTGGYSTNEFQVALANKFDPKKHKLNASWFLSRKLDGVRCIAKVGDGAVEFFSRTGKPFTTLKNLEADLLKSFRCGTVLDGEVCLVDDFGSEDFTGVVSEIKRKNWTIAKPKYFVFDMLSSEEFDMGSTYIPLHLRLRELQGCIGGGRGNVVLLQQKRYSEDTFIDMRTEAHTNGWEGLMARKDTSYRSGRSNDLLKIKEFQDAEYTVVNALSGNMDVQGVSKGSMLLSVDIRHKGFLVSVGSGFSLKQREEWGADPSKILGKTITVKYFEESHNRDGGSSLRFPTFKCLHGDKREV